LANSIVSTANALARRHPKRASATWPASERNWPISVSAGRIP
jgi:hypothetical protein